MGASGNNIISLEIIKSRLKAMGIEQYTLIPFKVNITEERQKIEIKNDIYILANEILDIARTARLELNSPGNIFETSKTEYENSGISNLQVFSTHIKVSLANYGTTFVPYQLEFIKVIPTKEKK